MSNKTSKTASLEERFNEIHAVASASLQVEKLRELSKSSKLARTRKERIHQWFTLASLADAQARSLQDIEMPLGSLIKRKVTLPPPIAFDGVPTSEQSAAAMQQVVKDIAEDNENS